jgi:two-component system, NarL family, capsular synthesis sensor histidine kinase RcsC
MRLRRVSGCDNERPDPILLGLGIAAEDLERLFEPFVQGDQPSTRFLGGTGLGLTIARQLARQMRGDIEVESTVGVGSRFHFRVPLEPVGQVAVQNPAS